MDKIVPNLDVLKRAASLLRQIHQDLDFLEVNLRYFLDIPVCLPNCGICCRQSFLVPAISAQYIAANIRTLPEPTQQILTERLERWVTFQAPDVRLRFSNNGQEEKALRDSEYLKIASLTCPFLDERKQCLIYPWRDINCRAWGITRPAADVCPRPKSAIESQDRLYIGESDERVQEIKYQIAMLEGLVSCEPSLLHEGWMPALVYRELQPEKWLSLRDVTQQMKSLAFTNSHAWLLTGQDTVQYALKEDPLKQSIDPL